ncbi:helix-turn-helix domain-containing protein [Streptomyces decoyicus]|uniref:helix-turn-helix domain-containing protein n=1 Tax=Streptomyces decoyicus TaxID=249567 RepID=UPI0036266A0D
MAAASTADRRRHHRLMRWCRLLGRPCVCVRPAGSTSPTDRLREKATVRAIAAEMGRSPPTVSREIRRNQHPDNGQYRPHAAQARADVRGSSRTGSAPRIRHFWRPLAIGRRWVSGRGEAIQQ